VSLTRQILMSCMSKSRLFMITLTDQSCCALVPQALPCYFNFVQVVLLSLSVTPMAAINGKSRHRMTGPRTGKRRRRWLLLKVTPYCKVSPVYRFHIYVLYAYQNLNSNCNIFISRILNPWFVCVYLWIFALLRIFQRDPVWRDPVWHSYFYDRGVTVEQLGTLPWCIVNYFETLRHRSGKLFWNSSSPDGRY
jgi:hypothetical protein